jgi:hypothetical protein
VSTHACDAVVDLCVCFAFLLKATTTSSRADADADAMHLSEMRCVWRCAIQKRPQQTDRASYSHASIRNHRAYCTHVSLYFRLNGWLMPLIFLSAFLNQLGLNLHHRAARLGHRCLGRHCVGRHGLQAFNTHDKYVQFTSVAMGATCVSKTATLLLPPFRNIRCFSFVKWVYLDILSSSFAM